LLCRLLRRYPRWSNGHRLLAEEGLTHNNIAQAYAASRCFQARSAFRRPQARALQPTYWQMLPAPGEWQSALTALREALEDAPRSAPILEELAAAHMLGGNYAEARSALEQITEAALSAQAKAALAFARTKP
jgi:tetratricopeptide (TPR) repeat protein